MAGAEKKGRENLFMRIYKSFEEARNGTRIPVFLSGRSMESRYNPERDAEKLLNSVETAIDFFLVFGIGSALFIEMLSKRNPHAYIIGIELYKEDIDFLLQEKRIKELSENSNIKLISVEQLEEVLINSYLPSKYGNLKIIEQRAWVNENQDKIRDIEALLKKTLGIISSDYSVQSHFGKIWTSNIINNTKLLESKKSYYFNEEKENIINKTALVVAAGPSLDRSLEILSEKEDRNNYFIIATDTAGQALIRHNYIPDIIVSIDGQSVSYNHFMTVNNSPDKETVYAFDLSANHSAARHLCQAGNKLLFFTSGHPLSSAINEAMNFSLPYFFSGAGTVTITALDLAVQSGFKKILILGADFSYPDGKAYAAGTYLDTLYNKDSSKLKDCEASFSRLMFRTELEKNSENVNTTAILQAYRASLEKYLIDRNIVYTKENDIYSLEIKSNKNKDKESLQGIFKKTASNFSLKSFIKTLKATNPEEIEKLLLPYIAWLRNNELYKNKKYEELVKLALESIVSYNI